MSNGPQSPMIAIAVIAPATSTDAASRTAALRRSATMAGSLVVATP